MASVSGQFFLAQINRELKTMNQNIDKILEFLYSDKKAELISEVSFVKSAYQNYSSIMEHEHQRFATLVNLQEAKKVAIKDIEFYMSDLDSASNTKSGSDITFLVDKMVQIKECLELVMQLYSMSSLLEIYYAQNYNSDYISNIEENSVIYISKFEKHILSDFSGLLNDIRRLKEPPLKKIDRPALEKKSEYYVNSNGDLYLKTA